MQEKAMLLCVIVLLITPAFAAVTPEDQITFRQSGYTFMRWNMGVIKQQVVDEPQSYDQARVLAAANVIAATAGSGIETLFSEQSATGKGWKDTRVKPEFFRQPDQVRKLFADFRKEADGLRQVATAGDLEQVRQQYDRLLKACKACHQDYRTKD